MCIKIYSNIQEFSGVGTEWLVIDDAIVLKLHDGNFIENLQVSSTDETLAK